MRRRPLHSKFTPTHTNHQEGPTFGNGGAAANNGNSNGSGGGGGGGTFGNGGQWTPQRPTFQEKDDGSGVNGGQGGPSDVFGAGYGGGFGGQGFLGNAPSKVFLENNHGSSCLQENLGGGTGSGEELSSMKTSNVPKQIQRLAGNKRDTAEDDDLAHQQQQHLQQRENEEDEWRQGRHQTMNQRRGVNFVHPKAPSGTMKMGGGMGAGNAPTAKTGFVTQKYQAPGAAPDVARQLTYLDTDEMPQFAPLNGIGMNSTSGMNNTSNSKTSSSHPFNPFDNTQHWTGGDGGGDGDSGSVGGGQAYRSSPKEFRPEHATPHTDAYLSQVTPPGATSSGIVPCTPHPSHRQHHQLSQSSSSSGSGGGAGSCRGVGRLGTYHHSNFFETSQGAHTCVYVSPFDGPSGSDSSPATNSKTEGDGYTQGGGGGAGANSCAQASSPFGGCGGGGGYRW